MSQIVDKASTLVASNVVEEGAVRLIRELAQA